MDSVEGSNQTKYECLLFDLDDTLYPFSTGLQMACRKNIQEYMLQSLNIEESQVPRMCLELYKEHGTTMAGLKVLGYEFDDDEFHAYVHGRLPYDSLKPDPVLRNLLMSVPQRKIIFTNADEAHATEALKRLGLEQGRIYFSARISGSAPGLEGCFEGVICFETLNPPRQQQERVDHDGGSDKFGILCKPSVEAFEAAIKIANVDPNKTMFFDDSVRNIASGKIAGLHTVIVGNSVLVPGADYALSSIHNIKEAIPEIWEGEGGEQIDPVMQSAGVETVVLA